MNIDCINTKDLVLHQNKNTAKLKQLIADIDSEIYATQSCASINDLTSKYFYATQLKAAYVITALGRETFINKILPQIPPNKLQSDYLIPLYQLIKTIEKNNVIH